MSSAKRRPILGLNVLTLLVMRSKYFLKARSMAVDDLAPCVTRKSNWRCCLQNGSHFVKVLMYWGSISGILIGDMSSEPAHYTQ